MPSSFPDPVAHTFRCAPHTGLRLRNSSAAQKRTARHTKAGRSKCNTRRQQTWCSLMAKTAHVHTTDTHTHTHTHTHLEFLVAACDVNLIGLQLREVRHLGTRACNVQLAHEPSGHVFGRRGHLGEGVCVCAFELYSSVSLGACHLGSKTMLCLQSNHRQQWHSHTWSRKWSSVGDVRGSYVIWILGMLRFRLMAIQTCRIVRLTMRCRFGSIACANFKTHTIQTVRVHVCVCVSVCVCLCVCVCVSVCVRV